MKKVTKTKRKGVSTASYVKQLAALPFVAKAKFSAADQDPDSMFSLSGYEIETRPNSLSILVRHQQSMGAKSPIYRKSSTAIRVPLLPMKIKFIKIKSGEDGNIYQALISLINPPHPRALVTPQSLITVDRDIYFMNGGTWYCIGDAVEEFRNCKNIVERAVLLAEFIQTAEHYDGGKGFARYAYENNLLPIKQK